MIDTSNLPGGSVLSVRDIARMRSSDQHRVSVVTEYSYNITDEEGNLGENIILGYDVSYFVDDELTNSESTPVEEDAIRMASGFVAD